MVLCRRCDTSGQPLFIGNRSRLKCDRCGEVPDMITYSNHYFLDIDGKLWNYAGTDLINPIPVYQTAEGEKHAA